MASPVELIKDRLTIQEVVGGYIKLEPAGANLKARCPFHSERTPSFFVSPARGTYHCFGCQKGGDIFSFVEEIEGLDFPQALAVLAQKAGVELKPVDPAKRSKEEKIYHSLELAAKYFTQELSKQKEVLKYLAERGLSDATIKDWQLGWAPDGWRTTADYLKTKGVSLADLAAAGLVTQPNNYDRFRGRIMFPIFSSVGRIVGFSGRLFGEGREDKEAKYINSPQTAVYDKSRLLYGYDRAKTAMRIKGRAILVEGQLDLLMAHQSGTTEAVATSGTALTPLHLNLIKRLTDNLILAYDPDPAGLAASRRAFTLALASDLTVKIAELPPGADPADLIKKDPKAWATALTGAKHLIDFWLEVIMSRTGDERERKIAVSREIVPLIAGLSLPLEQAHYVGLLSQRLAVPEEVVWVEVKKAGPVTSDQTKAETESVQKVTEPLKRRDRIEQRLLGLLWWGEATTRLDVAAKKSKLEALTGALYWSALAERLAPRRSAIMLEAELISGGAEHLESEIDELILNFEKEWWQEKLSQTFLAVKQAEAVGQDQTVQKLLVECQAISQQLDKIRQIKI